MKGELRREDPTDCAGRPHAPSGKRSQIRGGGAAACNAGGRRLAAGRLGGGSGQGASLVPSVAVRVRAMRSA